MKFTINYNIISVLLILFALISFFLGFYLDEISMGAGGFNGDFKHVKKSIYIFENNSVFKSILLYSESSNRPPLIYILHKFMNPFFESEIGFRRVVFFISLSIPILLFLCFKEKFNNTNVIVLLLFTSIIFFNPFFRTSSFWGLEENYSYISLLISLLFLLKFLNPIEKRNFTILSQLFIITFFSSLCIYFDQKFIIIPIICFLKIISSNYKIKFKIFSVVMYLIFSIPFLYLMSIWGGIFPSKIYDLGNQFFLHHIGFAFTIIAFIFLPFFLLVEENIFKKISSFFKNYNNYFLLMIILIYIIFLFFFYDKSFLENKFDGGGIVKKISFVLFENIFYREMFIYISFFLSGFLILLIINRNLKDLSIILFFLIIAAVTTPFYQEYFDPILFFLILFIFNFKINLKLSNGILLYIYFVIFLISSNFYYNNLI